MLQIVCNPQNPLGRTYPRETLLQYARFCEQNDLHLVSDEIYAMSVYDNPRAFLTTGDSTTSDAQMTLACPHSPAC
jgi:aspartate/methionine/tyrosine aminotransferase